MPEPTSAAPRCSGCGIWPAEMTHVCPPPLSTVRTLYNVRVTRADGVVIFDGSITDDDHFEMKQASGSSTRVSLSATAANRDSHLLNVALGVLQRHAIYGECSWHPGEYHGICSEAAR